MRKIILISLAVIALLGIAGNTIAYFTDEINGKAAVASGELSILQHEQEYAPDGHTLQPYTQNQMLSPGVFVDKIVTVENVGRHTAYVRTFVAVPTAGQGRALAEIKKGTDANWVWASAPLTDQIIDGRAYDIYAATYQQPLSSGEKTLPCMTGFTLSSKIGQKDGRYIYLDGQEQTELNLQEDFLILVATEASQAIVFEDAASAMQATYGSKRHPWVNGIIAASQQELEAALENASYNAWIDLKDGTYTLPEQLPAGIHIGAMGLQVKMTNTSLSGYDIEIDGVTFLNPLSFLGHGSFQETVFAGGCSAVPTTGDILFHQCTGAPGEAVMGEYKIVVKK